jgi:hypothetical protein
VGWGGGLHFVLATIDQVRAATNMLKLDLG